MNDPELELISLAEVKAKLMQNADFKVEYDELEERRRLIDALKAARLQLNLTQLDVAQKSGINVKNISRLERGIGAPTLKTLSRYAHALGGWLTFEFQPSSSIVDSSVLHNRQ